MANFFRDLLQDSEPETLCQLIKKILPTVQDRLEFPELREKRDRARVWSVCFQVLEACPEDRVAVLDFVRILSREQNGLDEVFDGRPEYVEKLVELAGLGPGSPLEDAAVAEAALKCLGNIGKQSRVGLNALASEPTIRVLVTRLGTEDVPSSVRAFDVRLLFLATALKIQLREFVRRDCDGLSVLAGLVESAVARGDARSEELGTRESTGPLDTYAGKRCVLSNMDADLVCDVLKVRESS